MDTMTDRVDLGAVVLLVQARQMIHIGESIRQDTQMLTVRFLRMPEEG
jgi:hypothetical protein